MARKWCINGRFLTQPITGVQRYALEVVRALDKHLAGGHPLGRGLDVEIVSPAGSPPPPALRAIRVRLIGTIAGHAWEQTVLPRLARTGLVSLCNAGPLLLRKQIVCIHDANTRECPGSYSHAFRALYRVLHPALGRRAAKIATVSRYSADRLVRHGICSREKIMVAPDGHEHALRWIASHSLITRAVAGPNTVVIIASPAPHKNVGLILGMAERIAEAGLQVAVAGTHDSRVLKGRQPEGKTAGIFWLGRLSDNELAAMLRDSLCLAFPSATEGFGLPALEAMAVGCPIVVADRASLPEICGDAALYASPFDGEAWLAAFLRLRNDERLRAELVARGRLRAAHYSWEQTAELYLKEMAHMDGLETSPEQMSAPREAQAGATQVCIATASSKA
jgi:glycosyltransferase involved in cell wall biosynthesis